MSLGVPISGDLLSHRVNQGYINEGTAAMYRQWDKLSGAKLEEAWAEWEARNLTNAHISNQVKFKEGI